MARKHVCANRFSKDGANGGCFVDIQDVNKTGYACLEVGWSCVIVHNQNIPVSWLAELVAIATAHQGGIKGFLEEHRYGGEQSYALMIDPEVN